MRQVGNKAAAILACSFTKKDYEKVLVAATRTLHMSFVLGVGLSFAVGVGFYFGARIFSKNLQRPKLEAGVDLKA
ncbi:hypothetical protein JHK85_010402 [Glycine max]|nr:hypothetical protein JHK85_010402 [Glycine max]